MKTTEFAKAKPHEFHSTPCHGGKGAWYFKDYISGMSKENPIVRFVHDDILPPGSEFGVHEHSNSEMNVEEWYLCLSGQGTMILDGEKVPFGEGDINVCRNGGSHGVINSGDKDMRILVFMASAKK